MRFLHTMIRVKDQDKAIDFYTRQLGMKVLRQKEYPSGKFTLTFVGYDDDPHAPQVELTYNWEQEADYQVGDAWGHIALGVKDIYGLCATLERNGVPVPRKPGPMQHGGRVIAFIRDPDNRAIELIQLEE
ncbi:MAG: lactoylglutathione lyase [Candidatus Lambdaproteobacteria bacterium]|nr:lactoylglutathione lyase [Candidatus Lambdaproteobacteria bacterium]